MRVPERIKGESDAEQIEKQAIMDVMLETRAWGKKYISNPFPYLLEDITSVNDQELYKLKKSFLVNVKKYQSFKEKNTRAIGEDGSKLFISEDMKNQDGVAKKKRVFF